MEKLEMREWMSALEEVIDNKLKKWEKGRIENGECVQVRWQFEQCHIILDVFWEDSHEHVQFQFHGPRSKHHFVWDGLTDRTFNKVVDRVGNLAMLAMYPPIDPELRE